jgi:hypothetical protein
VAGGEYESWFVSARDPASPRALWIRHTRHRPRHGPETAALWCTIVDSDLGQRPVVIKQVFGAFPADAVAGPAGFQGQASMGDQAARWDLAVTGGQPPLLPLRPAVLYRAPLPRTKLVATVPDGLVTGTVEVDGRDVAVSGWRGTVGHNWGSEHADSWVWLHAAGFDAAPEGWLELVLARIRIGGTRLPWTAMGALSLGGERIPLGGLGRRPAVDAGPDHLTASVPSPRARIQLAVTTAADTTAAGTTAAGTTARVGYDDPAGGTRIVSHAAISAVRLTLYRPGAREVSLCATSCAYEYGTSGEMPGTQPSPLPRG